LVWLKVDRDLIINLSLLVTILATLSGCTTDICIPGEFVSLRELENFLDRDETDKIIDPDWDCDDYARELQRRALEKGYLINIQLVGGGRLGRSNQHMICLCCIGNEMYFIEPTNDEIITMQYLDFPSK
jgi:hypothetical protein